MSEQVKLKDLEEALEGLPYPLTKANAVDELDGVVLQYADGGEAASDVVERIQEEIFDDPADLATSIRNTLPTEAVGEPGQAEGEGD